MTRCLVAVMVFVAMQTLVPASLAQSRRRADLVESRVGNPPGRMAPGSAFTITDAVVNRGRVAARPSLTRFFLVSGRTVLAAGSRRVPVLRAHASSRGRVRLLVSRAARPGRYAILACVDATRRVAERNERNNCSVSRGRLIVPGPGGLTPPPPPPSPPATSADSDGDGFPDSADCAPHDPTIHPGATDVPDLGFIDSNCDGIDGDPANAVFVSPAGDDANPGTMSAPLLTLDAAVRAAGSQSKDVYAAVGTYPEELRVAAGVGVYGGYDSSWQRSLGTRTRITGAVLGSGDVEGAVAVNVAAPTTLQLLTIAPAAPTAPGASAYGLRGVGSPGLRLERVTVIAPAGARGAAGAAGRAGAAGGNGQDGGLVLAKGGTSPVGHTGGDGGVENAPFSDGSGLPGKPGLALVPDRSGRMGGPEGAGGAGGSDHTAGGRGSDGDSGVFVGDGTGAAAGNAAPGSGVWRGFAGADGSAGSDGHGGGGGGGGGFDTCFTCFDSAGNGGSGGGGGQGGGGSRGGMPGGGSFGIFLLNSAGATVRGSAVSVQDGGHGGSGGGGALGGGGGVGGHGQAADGNDASDGGDGGRGGLGGRGGDGGGGAGGPSIAIVGLGPSDAPGTTVSHGSAGQGGAGGVGAGNGGGRGADGQAADYLAAA